VVRSPQIAMDFRILGPLEVVAPDGPVSLGGAKQRALLALLVLSEGEVLSTDRLIDALWDEQPPGTARKALQVHVSQLRKVLGPSLILTRPPGYALELDSHGLDVARFRALHDEARSVAASDPARARELLGEALELWRGPPLADFTYAPFAQAAIGRLEEMRIAAIEDRIAADMALARSSEVVPELEALIASHPHRERLRGQLMLALYRSGRQAEALEAFRAARAVLTDELGIEPGRELRELHQAILNQDPALDMTAAPSRAGLRPSETFVGRERELLESGEALDDAVAGRGRIVLVSGEAGIGKSRLAEELSAAARARGARVLAGRCWEAGGAPAYWPWVQALRAYVRATDPELLRAHAGRDAEQLVTLLPELQELLDLPKPVAPASEGARFRLLESIASFLGRAASDQPLALFLDDLHAADASSLLLLRFLAESVGELRLLIVASYRDTEAGPELAEAVAELAHEPAVRRLALKGLTESDTSRLLELIVGTPATDELAPRVQSRTQGNPLFATEIGRLLAAEARGEHQPGPHLLPQGIREAIRRRLRPRSSDCRELLTLASVMGREFDPEVLARVSGVGERDLARILDEAADARLVEGVPAATGRLRFSHILVRDTLYEELPAPRRYRLHRAAGDALEAHFASHPEPHLAELAHHYLEAGTPVAAKAAQYARRAGDRARAEHGYEEAARHYGNALRALDLSGDADSGKTCELLLALGEVLSRAGRDQEAKRSLQDAAALAEQTGRPDLLARAALEFGGRFAWARASTDPALVPLLERALAAIGDSDSRTRVRLLARLAGAKRDEPLRERRAAVAEEAIAIAREIGDPDTLAFAHEGRWVALEGPGGAASGLLVGERLIAIGQATGDGERAFAGHDIRFNSFWELADRAGVDVELDALSSLADKLRQPAQRWHAETGKTILALAEGRFSDAERLVTDTLALGRRAQSWNARVSQRLALFVLRRAQGRLAELEDVIARSVRDYPALIRFRCALAHLHAELGHERKARAALEDLLSRDLEHEHLDAEWLLSVTLLADPCAFLGDSGAAEKLYGLLLPYERLYAQAPVEISFGSVARALGVLATTQGRYEDAASHFEVALEIERGMRAHPWLAHAKHAFAAMLIARGDGDRARALIEEARKTYRELGMDAWATRAEETVAGLSRS
jgi:DNA-binding SARP family transcriptional activator/tetratricopeptide (TPR) repeat protein